ncbi:GNAT family N-acetyltransferase [Actinomyces sp. 2119]|uniref:GNAT family N-acetyltransferase n=1 Tax=Actinomyces sp. 2119 TaxID=2321393 RepID=UPI000E6BC1DB|nr:GNAT family N-acetyltransferase [Actinomyces sp. 2119]RJF44973.1 GNAT family N-acetyltransferase [Actinomyces sp. 2119]
MQPCDITVPADGDCPELLLSAPTLADIERIAEICDDPDIQEWLTVPHGYTVEDARDFVNDVAAPGWKTGKELTWGIRESDGRGGWYLVGLVSLGAQPGDVRTLGFSLAAQARGRGVMTRAVRAVVDLAFDASGPVRAAALRWVCEVHDGVPNWASWRVAWRLGFTREAHLRAALPNKGDLHDAWYATLLPGDPREPRAPWDGPAPRSVRAASGPEAAAPGWGSGSGGAGRAGAAWTPLVPHDGVGRREGDDPEALVRRFHHVYELPVRTDGPCLDRPSLGMRMSLVAEEFAELTGAVYGADARAEVEAAYARAVRCDDGTRDTVGAADALADLVYVIYGMALETGIDLAAVLAEVQRSNMSKLGEDGRPVYREDGKVLKGPGYFPPDVAGVLGLQAGDEEGRSPRS